jgi:long-chain acyl-CoA synthetase
VKICDSEGKKLPTGEMGEIVVKGENVMAGYWKNPESTAETIKDGFLYTGDLGYINHEGLLYVKGRFKSLLISSDGEKYSPEGIEEAMVEHSPYIDQIMLYNNQSPYTIALIVPNKEQLKRKVAQKNLTLESEEGRIAAIKKIEKELNKYRKGGEYEGMFPERWLPSTFTLLPEPFTEQNQMINSTMKMVRGKIEKAYQNRITELYSAEGKIIINPYNQNALK